MELIAHTNLSPIKMSSRDIAALVNSRHGNVCVAIERLMSSGVIEGYAALQYTHPQNGQKYHYYEVNKRDSYVIVAQLCPEFTARLVDRWQTLEGQRNVPQTLPEALRLAADLAEQAMQQQAFIEAAAPKIEFADRIAGISKGISIPNFAKTVGIGPLKLFEWMRDSGILIAGGQRHNLPLQRYIDRGYFAVRHSHYEANGERRASFSTSLSGKGEIWLVQKLVEAGLLKGGNSNAE
ncbi:phage antirepressor KilAC domain-containing protein [Pantoea agglomerans]|uniref:phage antirepressor KilAC domain-containing protein n=1 Tax=Enterobacter agglomerans TaxID=549 RepID=UPI00177C4DC4|nr:phage antirepressor KilAC domain-containing protein [Pantoea agglomerans]MBD8153332.1 phage antirepressor KilAC domain-containing protein [Pantoea agglomerans]